MKLCKTAILSAIVTMILSLSGVAEARHAAVYLRVRPQYRGRAHVQPGFRGKITSVGNGSFMMTLHRRGSSQSVTVNVSNATIVRGVPANDNTIVGDFVIVQGVIDGEAINATSVTVHAPKHRKAGA